MTIRRTANLAWVWITCVCFSLACVPDTMETDGGEQPDDSMQQPDTPQPNEPPAPPADLIALAWPAVESLCEIDEDCANGLFCDSLDQETIDAFLATVNIEDLPANTPLTVDENVCQFGCRIDSEFVPAGETDPDANGCRSCRPEISATNWSPVAAGTSCEDGLFCTSASGAAGDADACDGTGACAGQAVQCDDGLFCTGVESCDEGANACVSSGDPCPATECNTCQEDTDSCFDPAGSACGSDKDTTCDNPDTCDGAGTCESNIESPGFVCREATGPCDVPETCSSEGKCHSDVFRQAGFVCNAGSGDACDPDEVCSGTSAECPEDTFEPGSTVCNAGTGDVCDPDEFCPGVPDQGCPVDRVEFTSTVCRAAVGDCDEAEMCPGVADIGCPADEKKSASVECRPIVGVCDVAESCDGINNDCPPDAKQLSNFECNAAEYACDEPETCDGVTNDCPVVPPTICTNGAPCTADEQCQSGACIGEACSPIALLSEGCDSDGDCDPALVCDAGSCKSDRDGFCIETENCAEGLVCDPFESGRCKLDVGAACSTIDDCGPGLGCDASGVCKPSINSGCFQDDDCAGDLVCGCQSIVCVEFDGPTCIKEACDPIGICKVRILGDCTADEECFPGFHCPTGTCVPDLIALGDVCEVDPPGGPPAPVIGDSPNDSRCATGHCFRPYGGTGGPLNPPDYVCCKDVGESCRDDLDCCSAFLMRARGCSSDDTCQPLSIAGEACTTDADCLRGGILSCVAGTCEAPVVTPVLGIGRECDPANSNGYCDTGLQCLDCSPEGRGYRCVDAANPCCNSGRGDRFWCGDTDVPIPGISGATRSEDNLCCGYTCYDFDDPEHCGSCDRNCNEQESPCFDHTQTECVPVDIYDMECVFEDISGCDLLTDPDDETVCFECVATSDTEFTCDPFFGFGKQVFNNSCQNGDQCSSDSQCEGDAYCEFDDCLFPLACDTTGKCRGCN